MTSGESVSSIRRATLVRSSFCKRSFKFREVRKVPSLPANGESLTEKNMLNVGSSILTYGYGAGNSGSQSVVPIIGGLSNPVTATISPLGATIASLRDKPWKVNNFVILVGADIAASLH